jgi:hypothetical protein
VTPRITCGVYGRPSPNQAAHTQVRFWSTDVENDVAELAARGIVFEDYDLPALKTVDHVATTAGMASPRGSRIRTATPSRCFSLRSRAASRPRRPAGTAEQATAGTVGVVRP